MSRGEITINERLCKGCGYCVRFCPQDCIAIPGDRFSPQGYLLAVFTEPDRCNACGICGWMCPDFAIDVYRYVEAETPGA